MDNKSEIPDGLAMPDDLAKKVSEALNKKSITPEDELAEALDEMARDIALIEPDPQDWVGWVIYLLERLEVEARMRGNEGDFSGLEINVVSDEAQSVPRGVRIRIDTDLVPVYVMSQNDSAYRLSLHRGNMRICQESEPGGKYWQTARTSSLLILIKPNQPI